MKVTKPSAVGRELHQRRHAHDQEHARRYHRRRMDQRRNGRRPLHRVGQPDVQADLRRFAHGADEQQEADHLEGVELGAEQVVERVLVGVDPGEDGRKFDRAELVEDQRDADGEEQVANPVHDERLDGRGAGRRPVVPVADEQIAHQADALPAEEQLREVVGRHQHQHREREQRQVAEELRRCRVVGHVAGAVDVDQCRNDGDHRHHHRRQRIVAQRPRRLQRPGVDPGPKHDGARRATGADQGEDRQHAADRGEHHRQDRDELARLVADQAAEQPGDQGAEKRGEDGDGVEHAQPFIRVTSSTSIEPRLRK